MFGWSFLGGFGDASTMSSRKIAELQCVYVDTDCFLIDEVNAMSAESLQRPHEMMTVLFNPQKKKNCRGLL
jgi:hypothetical protein